MVECGTYGSVYFLKRLLMSLLSMCARCIAAGQVWRRCAADLLSSTPPESLLAKVLAVAGAGLI